MDTSSITVTDMFCGAGGSTTGATQAGAEVVLAINHWDRAIETHNTNHPNTRHALTDLHKASPRRFPSSRILVASPECTNHSISKGQKRLGHGQKDLWQEEHDLSQDAEERSRCTMWTPLDWAEYHQYDVVILENVVEARQWAPFHAWLQAWDSLGYDHETVYLNSMHAHPTPQSRDRMYFVGWRKKNKKPNLKITPSAFCGYCDKNVESVQCWKNTQKRHGKYRQQYVYCCPYCAEEVIPYYYAAANAIDWSLPSPCIADRKKPLQPKTMKRIMHGIEKFSQQPPDSYKVPPFLLNLNHESVYTRHVLEHPFFTQTTYDDTSLVTPPFLMDHLGEYRPRAITGPCSTICASGNHHSIVTPDSWRSWLMTYYNNGQMCSTQQAIPTVTTLARHALVTSSNPTRVSAEECGFRMLVPKEIQAAMAFPESYVITGTRREQVKQLGNAVTAPVMKLLMERVIASLS